MRVFSQRGRASEKNTNPGPAQIAGLFKKNGAKTPEVTDGNRKEKVLEEAEHQADEEDQGRAQQHCNVDG